MTDQAAVRLKADATHAITDQATVRLKPDTTHERLPANER